MFYNYQKYHQQTSAIHGHRYANSFLQYHYGGQGKNMHHPNKQLQLLLQLAILIFLVVLTAVSQNSSESCQQHVGNPALLFSATVLTEQEFQTKRLPILTNIKTYFKIESIKRCFYVTLTSGRDGRLQELPTGELKSITGGPYAFPSHPTALVTVGLDGVDDVLLAVEGAVEVCPLQICH